MISPTRFVAVLAAVGVIGACSGSGRSTTRSTTSTSASTSTAAPSTSVAGGQSATSLAPVPTTGPTPGVHGPVGGPVPSGIKPISVTFDSPTEGFVLANAACSAPPCTSILRTRDGGRTWAGIPAPRTPPGGGASAQIVAGGLERIRFASALDGWVFGPALYATHDGGASWNAVSLPGSVVDLEASAGQAFALVSQCLPSAPECSSSASLQATLWHSTSGGDHWAQVQGVSGTAGGGASSIFLHGTRGWVVLTDSAARFNLFFTSDGASWNQLANPCAGDTPGLVSIAAVATTTGFLCIGQGSSGQEPKRLLVSTDDGRTTRVAGPLPNLGDGGTLAALSPTTWVVANASAASWVYRSTDGGRVWSAAVTFNDGGSGFSDFGFTTASQGVAIHRPYANDPELILSRDGAATWHPVTF